MQWLPLGSARRPEVLASRPSIQDAHDRTRSLGPSRRCLNPTLWWVELKGGATSCDVISNCIKNLFSLARAEMAVCFACFAVLLSVSVVREAGGVISGPLFPRDKGLIEPVELEIPESEELPAFARRAMQGSPDRLARGTRGAGMLCTLSTRSSL